MSKLSTVSVRLDKSYLVEIEKLAKEQDISAAAYIRQIITGHFFAIGLHSVVGAMCSHENGDTYHFIDYSVVERIVSAAREIAKSSTEKEEEKEKRDLPPTPPIERKEKREEKEMCVSRTRVREMFVEFWTAFPGLRKINRKKTFEKFEKIIEEAENPEEFFRTMMIALNEKWKDSYLWQRDDGQYICAPIVWLNQERWNDEPESAIGIANNSRPINWRPTERSKIQEVF